MKKIYSFLLILMLFITGALDSCKKEDKGGISALDLEINEFIWGKMYYYYLWADNVPNLSPSKSSNKNDLIAFLSKYSDHEKLFNDLLYKTLDRFSWIVDDYVALENQFQGTKKSMGLNFQLVRYSSTSNNIFGYVRYVVKGSPAYRAGIKRGDIFIKVNYQQLTVSNYQQLLVNNDSYKLSFAYISNNNIIENNKEVSLTAEVVNEDPIYLDTIYNINGTKIGYLVYNGFISSFDIKLNEVFQRFKDQGIQKLILDLRYNPGGYIESAINLASMIYTTDTNKVFCKNHFNNFLQDTLMKLHGSNYFNSYFADSIKETDKTPATPIVSVNLDKVYIIATGSSASASELVINGLKSHIPVITIGSNTYGKYVGSITIKDYDSKGILNPNHKWALQPIILKMSNSAGETDYVNGLAPTDSVQEDIANLLPFGNVNETLLKATIDYIQGNPKKKALKFNMAALGCEVIADSKDLIPHSKEMYFRYNFINATKY